MSKTKFSIVLEDAIKDLDKESTIKTSEHFKGEPVNLGSNIGDVDRRVNRVINNESQVKEPLSLYDSDIDDLNENKLDMYL